MSRNSYFLLTAIIFSIVAFVHLVRIVLEWDAAIGGWSIPMWVSWLALVVSAALAYFGFGHARDR